MKRYAHGHRGTLQRRLFLWFGGALLLVALLVAAIAHFSQQRDATGFTTAADFVAARFAERWEQDAALQALADELAATINVEIEVRDLDELVARSGSCGDHALRASVRRGGEVVGEIRVCKRHRRAEVIRGAGLIGLFLFGLWLIAGQIAKRLSRSLQETAELAEKIGGGDFSARLEEHHHDPAEVRTLKNALNQMARRVEAHAEDQKLLLASVSHEIRTPLGHARLLIDHARDHGLDERYAGELEDEVLAIDDLVGQLLAGGKLDAIGTELREVDGAAIARRALEAFDESDLSADDDVQLRADPTLLLRALTNLIRNARDHGGGLRSVTVTGSDDEVCFLVRDHGDGLTNEELAQLVAPYARKGGPDRRGLDNADSRGSLGLGLSLTARIARAHDGTLSAESGDLVLRLPRSGPRASPNVT